MTIHDLRNIWEKEDQDGEVLSFDATGFQGPEAYGIAVHGNPRSCVCLNGRVMMGVFMSIEDLKALRDVLTKEIEAL